MCLLHFSSHVFWIYVSSDAFILLKNYLLIVRAFVVTILMFLFSDCCIFNSLQAKGYRVGPVYDDVLAMAWFFLELIVKSMALEQSCLFDHNLPIGSAMFIQVVFLKFFFINEAL